MEIHGSFMVLGSLVVLKKGIIFKNVGSLSGKAEMATKVAQVVCAIFLNNISNIICHFIMTATRLKF